jgi:hypothetical protein
MAQPEFREIDVQEPATALPPAVAPVKRREDMPVDGVSSAMPVSARGLHVPEKVAIPLVPSGLAALERVSLPADFAGKPAAPVVRGEKNLPGKVEQAVARDRRDVGAAGAAVLRPPVSGPHDASAIGRHPSVRVEAQKSEMEKMSPQARVESRLMPRAETAGERAFGQWPREADEGSARMNASRNAEPPRRVELTPAPPSQRQTSEAKNVHRESPSHREATVRIGSLHVRIHPPAAPAPQPAVVRHAAPKPTGTLSRGFRGFSFAQG